MDVKALDGHAAERGIGERHGAEPGQPADGVDRVAQFDDVDGLDGPSSRPASELSVNVNGLLRRERCRMAMGRKEADQREHSEGAPASCHIAVFFAAIMCSISCLSTPQVGYLSAHRALRHVIS
jgi:hypothetical protein